MMYDFLAGEIAELAPTRLVLDVGGVGFALEIPLSTFEVLPRGGGEARVFCHLHVREDTLKLYGFATTAERLLFELLLTVSGIGPGVAINLLSRATVSEIRTAILEERLDFLTTLKGVGKKTAQRMVTELKDRVGVIDGDDGATSAGSRDSRELDAIQALQVLGYPPKAAQRAVLKACEADPDASVESVIRAALKTI